MKSTVQLFCQFACQIRIREVHWIQSNSSWKKQMRTFSIEMQMIRESHVICCCCCWCCCVYCFNNSICIKIQTKIEGDWAKLRHGIVYFIICTYTLWKSLSLSIPGTPHSSPFLDERDPICSKTANSLGGFLGCYFYLLMEGPQLDLPLWYCGSDR